MPKIEKDKKFERRTIHTPVTIEKREDGTIKSITGHPIVFNQDSEDMGFIEQIDPKAVTDALIDSDVRGLKNHNSDLIFGREGVNLTLGVDKIGVFYRATPVDTFNFTETAKEVALRLLDGQSFGFTVLEDKWTDLDKDTPRRRILKIGTLFDVGPVTFPAYLGTDVELNDTTVALRSLTDIKKGILTDEKDLVTRARNKKKNLDIDILMLERNNGGLKR